MAYFKTEKHLYPFASAFNLNRNYYETRAKPAYNFKLLDIDSNSIDLFSLAEEFLLIDFWAAWCVPCVKGMPVLNQFQKENPNIRVVMISRDRDFKTFKTFVDESNYDLEFYYSGTSQLVSVAYQIQSLPHKALVGNDKNIYLNKIHSLSELGSYKAFWE